MRRHLAQLNIATLRHPLDDPRIADFVEGLPAVNGAGERSPGYVWRLQSDSGDATDIQVFDDPLVIVNLTVWESLDALKAFAYRGVHRDFFRRRAEWFVEGSSRTALWWLPAGDLPTTDDAKRRLEFIDAFDVSPYAFEMGQNHVALVIEHVGLDDERAQRLLHQHNDDVDPDQLTGDGGCFVVAEIDDVAVACGAYRRLDDTTAEIRRIFVAPPARGVRVGAAIVAELEAAARRNGLQRLLLESGPRQLPMLGLYEKFGFRRCQCWGEYARSTTSICIEKTLTAEPGRLA
ncbi:MAG: GNAT family N-acetyltransferase [Actinomycetota bacterium]|nr:GNAT family N-acetyltransferase [Actinomycetota bacterium]